MSTTEPLCDLRMIKADYRLVSHKDRQPDHCFRIRVIPNKQEMQFDVPEKNGELFAAELRAGPGCLNRFSASISGASAEVRLPSGEAAA